MKCFFRVPKSRYQYYWFCSNKWETASCETFYEVLWTVINCTSTTYFDCEKRFFSPQILCISIANKRHTNDWNSIRFNIISTGWLTVLKFCAVGEKISIWLKKIALEIGSLNILTTRSTLQPRPLTITNSIFQYITVRLNCCATLSHFNVMENGRETIWKANLRAIVRSFVHMEYDGKWYFECKCVFYARWM